VDFFNGYCCGGGRIMFIDVDLEWYFELLLLVIVGIVKIGFSDVVCIGKCGKVVENDKWLYMYIMYKVVLKYFKIFLVL